MSYFSEIDAWLDGVLLGGEEGETAEKWIERVKKDVKDKILESYRNGQKAGPRTNANKREIAKPDSEAVESKWRQLRGS